MTWCETQSQDSVLVESSSFDGGSRHDLVAYLAGFIMDCDVRWSQYSSEGCKGCQRIASAAACGTIKFCRPIQFGCMNGQMAGCYESINAYPTAHYVVTDLVDYGVRCFGFREAHVRAANRRQCRTKEKFVVEKI